MPEAEGILKNSKADHDDATMDDGLSVRYDIVLVFHSPFTRLAIADSFADHGRIRSAIFLLHMQLWNFSIVQTLLAYCTNHRQQTTPPAFSRTLAQLSLK